MIKAETHSDDYVIEATFDATPWFEQATDEQLTNLADIEWGGDYAADVIAEFFADKDTMIAKMFQYIELVRDTSKATGFECNVVEADALNWIKANRPQLYDKLKEENLIDG